MHQSGQEQEEKTGLPEPRPSSTRSSTHHEVQAVRMALEGCKSMPATTVSLLLYNQHYGTIHTMHVFIIHIDLFLSMPPLLYRLVHYTRYVYLSYYIGRRYISEFCLLFVFLYLLDAPFYLFPIFYTYCLPREERKVWDGISNRPSTFQLCFFCFTFSFAILYNTQERHHWPASIASLYDCLGSGGSK